MPRSKVKGDLLAAILWDHEHSPRGPKLIIYNLTKKTLDEISIEGTERKWTEKLPHSWNNLNEILIANGGSSAQLIAEWRE